MATALIGGLVARGARRRATFASSSRSPAQRDTLAARFPGIALHRRSRARRVAGGATLVVLAVKPQQMRDAARRSRRIDRTRCRWCCRSPPAFAAPTCRAGSAAITRIVRAMPNTPALVGAGISGVVRDAGRATPGAAPRAAACSRPAAKSCGCAREATLDAVTGVSGSGPAYVFYFLEGAGAGGARARASARPTRASSPTRRSPARSQLAQAVDAEPRDVARAGDVEGRHHRARDRACSTRATSSAHSSPR